MSASSGRGEGGVGAGRDAGRCFACEDSSDEVLGAALHKAYALGLGVVSVACSMFSVLPLDSSIPGIRLGDDGTICRTMVSSCQKRTVGEAVVSPYGKSSVAFGTGRPRRRLAKFRARRFNFFTP